MARNRGPETGPGTGTRWLTLFSSTEQGLARFAWFLSLVLVGLAAYLLWRSIFSTPAKALAWQPSQVEASLPPLVSDPEVIGSATGLPEYAPGEVESAIPRRSFLHTFIPNRSRRQPLDYTVQKGDSVFEIARRFDLRPESVLWGNYTQLNDNPDLLSVGMQLLIPPVDGVLYQWQTGDTLESVAGRFNVAPENLLNWSGNNLDLVNPQVEPGVWVMVPDGRREFRQWLIPTIPRGAAGVSSSVYGGGACTGNYEGAYGTGTFAWPSSSHSISGNDYWEGHLAIDIGVGEGQPISAADSGVVVFAGWANGGYGNTVAIDHGNGYQTLYAHMSKVTVNCGQSTSQGSTIGLAGSTGNSTGAHLHFEVRYQGGFISPWFVLP